MEEMSKANFSFTQSDNVFLLFIIFQSQESIFLFENRAADAPFFLIAGTRRLSVIEVHAGTMNESVSKSIMLARETFIFSANEVVTLSRGTLS